MSFRIGFSSGFWYRWPTSSSCSRLLQASFPPGQPPSVVFASPTPPQMNPAPQPRQVGLPTAHLPAKWPFVHQLSETLSKAPLNFTEIRPIPPWLVSICSAVGVNRSNKEPTFSSLCASFGVIASHPCYVKSYQEETWCASRIYLWNSLNACMPVSPLLTSSAPFYLSVSACSLYSPSPLSVQQAHTGLICARLPCTPYCYYCCLCVFGGEQKRIQQRFL